MLTNEDRRTFLRLVAGLATVAGGAPLVGCSGSPLASASVSAQARAASTAAVASTGAVSAADAPIVNFALNLQYLAAQFYAYASSDNGLSASVLTGTGAQGGPATGGLQLLAVDPAVARYASEIATDKASRLTELRAALSSAAVSQPAIRLSASVGLGASSENQTTVASIIGEVASAFGSDRAFLSAALLFEDVSGAAFRGALPQVTGAAAQAVLSDLLADSTYHASLLRSALVAEGASDASLKSLSDVRERLDGVAPPQAGAAADGQDILTSNGYVVAFSRSPPQALNVLYQTPAAASAGGFFPQGLNGAIRLAA